MELSQTTSSAAYSGKENYAFRPIPEDAPVTIGLFLENTDINYLYIDYITKKREPSTLCPQPRVTQSAGQAIRRFAMT